MTVNRFALYSILGFTLLVSFIGYFILPVENIPVPEYARMLTDQQPNRWAILLFLPLVSVACASFLISYPHLHTKYKDIGRQRGYRSSVTIIALALLMCHVLNISFAAGLNFNPLLAFNFIIAFVLLFSGNYLTTVRRNYFFGVVSPWALKDEKAWVRTQRFAAKLYIIAGGVLLLAPIVLQNLTHLLWIIPVVTLLLVIIVPIIYSARTSGPRQSTV